ncbi:MAG: CBS domain-containing protein [Holophagales bacterium]|nr:CBS domain-containing protein [Holophagales bacterium]
MADLSLPSARDLMEPADCILRGDMDLLDAVDQLLSHRKSAAPVVGESGELEGLLTEKDCLRILTRLAYDSPASAAIVRELQSEIVSVCEPEMDLFRVSDLFLQNNFPLLPVAEQGRLLGTISRQRMLQAIQELRYQVVRLQDRFERSAGKQADRPRGIESMQRTASSLSPDQLVRVFGR